MRTGRERGPGAGAAYVATLVGVAAMLLVLFHPWIGLHRTLAEGLQEHPAESTASTESAETADSGPGAESLVGSTGGFRSRPHQAPKEWTSSYEPDVVPVRLEIPVIDVDHQLMGLGLTEEGELEVPGMGEADTPGWYKYAPTPGDVGPAVIAGHLDSDIGPAVFYELGNLAEGDTIRVHRSDDHVAVFEVTSVKEYLKSRFPSEAVYGAISHPGLRLITCSGPYVEDRDGYQRNIVVFAKLRRLIRDDTWRSWDNDTHSLQHPGGSHG